ncbi:MAG TPA: bifunctional DNA-formamidopyrimidine glycosylase/DNA-(apurinic or apyrimidinic site) lyase [Candidatus Avacidaminococcus intestinavium]|uniref:Formamidopyrimidine-DNA glycosylase n=1 Tax=Candidatus Avacidaminococcus intestinavium TaxID=2840684 RepID=A0A9D1SLI1_9FIRM|nr:bifunctional DNA-formamidopyrimidine glycosylase/DNA-(apurinic or apyrimidinic site) lyase [Candidatus Avacidaminococcus intestinavium]
MPELPEIEQVRKTLVPHIINKIVKRVEVRLPRMIKHPSAEQFADILIGQCIVDLKRNGKYLTIEFATNLKLVMHLRMTGALIVTEEDAAEPKYAKVKIELTGGKILWFCDIRTFGTLHLIINDDITISGLAELGPEPSTPSLNTDYLLKIFQRRKGPVKGVILDQTVIAGLGNIYADEALATANILPERSANSLSVAEIGKLISAINAVIAQGIKNHGTTFRDYKDGNGEQGSNQKYLLVYGRKGQPCKNCGTVLVGTKVAGRGTTFCPHCQH